jgi:hypothetical protein
VRRVGKRKSHAARLSVAQRIKAPESYFFDLLRLRDITLKFVERLSCGLPFLWSMSFPSPFLTLPDLISDRRAALRPARFFFCFGLLW